MSSSCWLLALESRDLSQAEKERTACKAEQIHKEKSRESTPNSQKLEDM